MYSTHTKQQYAHRATVYNNNNISKIINNTMKYIFKPLVINVHVINII